MKTLERIRKAALLVVICVGLFALWANVTRGHAQSTGTVVVDCTLGVGLAYTAGSTRPMTLLPTGAACVNASVSASITGFPTTQSTGTPISVTTSSGAGSLPTGAVVVASNVGATNGAYCKLGATATTSDQLIPPNSWFAFTVGSATQLACITSTSTTTVNMVGGSGLPTGSGGGGGGSGGGAVTVADGANVVEGSLADAAATAGGTGTFAAKFRLMTTQLNTINTTLGTPLQAGGTVVLTAETTKVIGTVRIASGGVASGSYASGSIASGAVASGAVASGAIAAGALAAGAGVDGWDLTQGAIADAAATQGSTGSVSAKLRTITSQLNTGNGSLATIATNSALPLPAQTGIGNVNIGAVQSAGSAYETVAASQTGQALGATGATGDYLSHCVIYPVTTGAGLVTVFDSTSSATNNVITFTSGTLSNLAPIALPVGALSLNGAWKVTTGANVTVTCYGKFT